MRAPDTKERFDASNPAMEVEAREVPWATFSAAQWQEIEDALAAVDVDLDAATVVNPFDGPHAWGWEGWEDYTPEPDLLPYVLQQCAYAAARVRERKTTASTPKQRAESLRKEVDALDQALAVINPDDVGPGLPPDDVAHARQKRRTRLRTEMTLEIAERRRYIAKLEAAGSRSKDNARTTHNDYWELLAKLWRQVAGSAGPKRRQRLGRFLLACTPPSLFADMTQQQLERSAAAFVSNYFRSR
jgi:hypothetical protein